MFYHICASMDDAKIFCHFKKSTRAKKGISKVVANQVIPPYVVSNGNTIMTYIFGNHYYACTHSTRYLLILIIYPSLVFSVFMTFTFTKVPTLIFILPHFDSFLSLIIVSTVNLIAYLRGGAVIDCVATSKHTVGLFSVCGN